MYALKVNKEKSQEHDQKCSNKNRVGFPPENLFLSGSFRQKLARLKC